RDRQRHDRPARWRADRRHAGAGSPKRVTGMPAPASHRAPRRIAWVRSLLASPARRLALGVALGFATLIGGTIWRMRGLDGLPDVGDPFDVAEARRPIEISDADNAFVAYAAAHRLLENGPNNQVDYDRYNSIAEAVREIGIESLTWSSASPASREYLKA